MAVDLYVEPDIWIWLTNEPSINALLGNRIYPDHGPQHPTLPYAVYFRISTETVDYLRGSGGVSYPRIQLDVYGETAHDTRSLAYLIAEKIRTTPQLTMNGRKIQSIKVVNSFDN